MADSGGTTRNRDNDIASSPMPSSSRDRLQHPPSVGRADRYNAPTDAVQDPSSGSTPYLTAPPKRQNSDQVPKPPSKKPRVSNSGAPIHDQEHSSPISIDETPSASFKGSEGAMVCQTTNYYHIDHIGNAILGDNHGTINQTFTETLLKRLPDLSEASDPATVVLEIAKMVTKISQDLPGYLDVVDTRIAAMASELLIVEKALQRWPEGAGWQKNSPMQEFKSALSSALERLHRLQECATAKMVGDHESQGNQIERIFKSVDDARMRFELDSSIRLYYMVDAIDNTLKRSLRKDLEVSDVADYKYVGKGKEKLHRVPCTPRTRVHILDMMIRWANGNGEKLFWLFGPAGSGKSTIAYTIARRFEMTVGAGDKIVLGGNFFCSRQFEGARDECQIVRTIVYHLALKCKSFAQALERFGKFDTIYHSVDAQLVGLLVKPWRESRSAPKDVTPSQDDYLFVIDAVDELVNDGGPTFLRALLTVLNEYDLPGLKFLVTSRSDANLVQYIDSFDQKQLCRLQDVEKDQVQADIRLYLEEYFPHFKGCDELDILLTFADGLFICAATLERYLEPRSRRFTESEQRAIIQKLPNSQATSTLDALYSAILSEAFRKCTGDILATRLNVLYTFLSTLEPTTTTAVGVLLSADSIPSAVLSSLHAVLYTDAQHRILFYHKSFSDFMFDPTRCPETFRRAPAVLHRRLAESCFRVMNTTPSGLRFNIANIPTSFTFDRDDDAFKEEVSASIPTVLDYSCRGWTHHLLLASEATADDPLHRILAEFLELRVLFWIEGMNLLGCRSQCQLMLQAASQWARGQHAILADQLAQVVSFALYFSGSPAALSTPHLYISTLATWRRSGEPFENWRKHFPGIPQFTTIGAKRASQLMNIAIGRKVYALALACGGTRIVTGLEDRTVRVWILATGNEERVLRGHTGKVRSVAGSSNGLRIVSGSNDRSMHVWNGETGVVEWTRYHTDIVRSVALSSDGTRIVSSSGNLVCVWDAGTGGRLMMLKGHTKPVRSVAISRESTTIASGACDGSVRIWDAITGQIQKVLQGPSAINSVAFSADGSRIAAGFTSNELVLVWNTGAGEEHWRNNQDDPDPDSDYAESDPGINSVAFSTDGTRVVAGFKDGSVRVWKILTNTELEMLNGHSNAVNSVVFLGGGTQIVSGSGDGSVCVWDPAAGKGQGTSQGHTDAVCSVAFSKDGTRIVSGSGDHTVCVWDVVTGEQQRILEGHTGIVRSVAFSNDGTSIVSGSEDRSIRLWDAVSGEQKKVLWGHTGMVYSVAFSGDGTRIVSGSGDKSARVWDVATGEEQMRLWGHTDEINAVAISSDGTRIASGSDDHSIRLWDAVTGEKLKALKGHTRRVWSVAFSGGGTCIVSGSADRSVRVWDTTTGEERKVLGGHTGGVRSVAISSDGTQVVSGSDDHSIRVWDTVTGEEQKILEGHRGWVMTVAFSNDGTYIVSGSYDHAIRVWSLTPFPCTSETSQNRYGTKTLTGWLISPSNPGDRLMYVPPDAHPPRPPCRLIIAPKHPCSSVDFTNSAVGNQWQNCYTPQP